MSFDFGADPVQSGGNLAQAAVGQHEARLLGVVHLGMYEDVFRGEVKPAAPFVCALFELKSGADEGGVNEDGTPIIVHYSFPLKRGDRSNLTKFMKAVLTPDEFKQYEANVLDSSFGELVGRAVLLDMEGSKKKDDNGDPMYTNVAGMSRMPAKLEKLCDELENEPIGHVTMSNMTEAAVKAIPVFELYGKMQLAINYPGSKAEEVIEKIREEDPDFGTQKESEDGDKGKQDEKPPVKERDDLDEDEDFS